MTGPATEPMETKESLRQRLTAIQHKDRWDDRDRKEVRAIQAALSCLAQHIPEPSREQSYGCCEAHGEADGVGRTRHDGKTAQSVSPASSMDVGCARHDGTTDESAIPASRAYGRETDAGGGAP